jgi:hypothetical protein
MTFGATDEVLKSREARNRSEGYRAGAAKDFTAEANLFRLFRALAPLHAHQAPIARVDH